MALSRETSLQQTEGKEHTLMVTSYEISPQQTEGKTLSYGTFPRDFSTANRSKRTHPRHLPTTLLYSKYKEWNTLMVPSHETPLPQTESKTHYHGTFPRDFSAANKRKGTQIWHLPMRLLQIKQKKKNTLSWHIPMRLLYGKQK